MTQDLVSRGLASVRRKRRIVTTQSDDVRDRFSDSNMDTSNVRHPSGRGVSIGDASTHGLATAGVEPAICQNHNIYVDPTLIRPNKLVLSNANPNIIVIYSLTCLPCFISLHLFPVSHHPDNFVLRR